MKNGYLKADISKDMLPDVRNSRKVYQIALEKQRKVQTETEKRKVEKKKLTIELKRRSWQLSWKEEVNNWVEKKKLTIELKRKKLTIELKRRSWQLSWKEEVNNWVEKKKLTIELS